MAPPIHLKRWEKYWRRTSLWKHRYSEKIHKREELVECECWTQRRVMKTDLTRWHSKSCGCYNRDITRQINKIHWDSKTKLYKHYHSAKSRCLCKTDKRYKWYWWRWIKIEWDNYESFKKDMYQWFIEHSKKYWEDNTTLDRVDVDWNYSKDNCRRTTISKNCWENKRQLWEYRFWISAEELSRQTWYKKDSLYALLHKFSWDFDKLMGYITKNKNFIYYKNIKNVSKTNMS